MTRLAPALAATMFMLMGACAPADMTIGDTSSGSDDSGADDSGSDDDTGTDPEDPPPLTPVACDVPQVAPGRYPAPRNDVVPAVGSDSTFDLATWNIENFTPEDDTPSRVADLIVSLDLDFVAIQEVIEDDAFYELVDRLPGYDGVLANIGAFHRTGYVYRTAFASVSNPTAWYPADSFSFPREPFSVEVAVDGCGVPFDFVAVNLHLKAGRGNDDANRRRSANSILDELTQDFVSNVDEDVIILGDFNEVLTTDNGQDVMAPWLDSARYRIRNEGAVADELYSFVPTRVFLDYIVTTVGFDREAAGNVAVVPPLDFQYSSYTDLVSDHLPVVLSVPYVE